MNNLKKYRLMLVLTQEDLAKKSGISEQTINMLETGKQGNPKISTIRALSDALGQPAIEVFPEMLKSREKASFCAA